MTNHRSSPIFLLVITLGLSAGCAGSSNTTSNRPIDRTVSLGAAAVAEGVHTREPWRFGEARGEVIRTRNYRIYTTESSQILVDRLTSFTEHALAHYRTAIVTLPEPPQRLDTYLMDNRSQYEALTRRLLPEQAETILKIMRGGFASRGIGVYYDIGLYDTLAIAAHEGWHQYVQRTFANPLPVYLDEGLATFMEGHSWISGPRVNTPVFRPWGNIERYDQLRSAVHAGRTVSLHTLTTSRPQDLIETVGDGALDYYAQVWALAHFLNTPEHRASLGLLLQEAASGQMRNRLIELHGRREATAMLTRRLGPEILRLYFNANLDELNHDYQRFLIDLAAVGSRDAIAAGRSPFD
ncbi:MAG: DUF1570 domain-containing protein [Phycisphaerales bacterium]